MIAIKKSFPTIIIISIWFLVPSLIFGFIFWNYQFSNSVLNKEKDNVEERVIDFVQDELQSNSDQSEEEFENENQRNNIDMEDSELDNINNVMEDSELDDIKKVMEDSEVVETLISVSEQLDDVNTSLDNDNQKEMISLVQKSVTAYMNQQNSYKKDITRALDIYMTLTTQEQIQIQRSLISNVGISKLLFLKKSFGY